MHTIFTHDKNVITEYVRTMSDAKSPTSATLMKNATAAAFEKVGLKNSYSYT